MSCTKVVARFRNRDVGYRRTASVARGLAGLLMSVCFAAAALAQAGAYASREEALAGIGSSDADRRAEAIVWIASHGTQDDTPILRERLKDENPYVRNVAEQGLWELWSHSGDEAIDALLKKGVEEMQSQAFEAAIETFSEIVRRKPDFAEGWNKRATVLFLAGEFRRSLADCDEVMKRNPLHFGALAGYGQIYFQLEQYEKAIGYWKRALEVNPNMTGIEISIKAAEELIARKRNRSA